MKLKKKKKKEEEFVPTRFFKGMKTSGKVIFQVGCTYINEMPLKKSKLCQNQQFITSHWSWFKVWELFTESMSHCLHTESCSDLYSQGGGCYWRLLNKMEVYNCTKCTLWVQLIASIIAAEIFYEAWAGGKYSSFSYAAMMCLSLCGHCNQTIAF